jgi:hypothetical protein
MVRLLSLYRALPLEYSVQVIDAMDDIEELYYKGKDPVRHCIVYKEIGCSHVDGYLCNMSDCSIRREYMCKEVVNSGSNRPGA